MAIYFRHCLRIVGGGIIILRYTTYDIRTMPDKRTHRGPHPADEKLFAAEAIGDLRAALADFSLLLTKGYAEKSALKLVGDKFSLTKRQRLAVMRGACSDKQVTSRRQCEVTIADVADQQHHRLRRLDHGLQQQPVLARVLRAVRCRPSRLSRSS